MAETKIDLKCKEALEHARETLVEWYVQDQADVVGEQLAVTLAHKEVHAIRLIDALLDGVRHEEVAE